MKKVLAWGSAAAAGSLFGFGLAATGSSECEFCSLSYRFFIQPVLMQMDPESAHRLAIKVASTGLVPKFRNVDPKILETTVWGKTFRNPIGLAAGFDKNAEAVESLLGMGFGFVEIGSVTPLPQPGNPRPRVFRLMEDKAVINRYGFNSDGADMVSQRLEKLHNIQGILGINLGKNKETEDAAKDYVIGVNKLGKYGDYIVVNVSSPNTVGLRRLQGKQYLQELLQSVVKVVPASKPLLVKIAPDLTEEELADVAEVVMKNNISGIIVSNTTISRDFQLQSKYANEQGGLSGSPLKSMSTNMIRKIYKLTSGKVPIIGVGGVSSGLDAYQKIRAGASLVQLYSAMVFEGPHLIPRIKWELAECLKRDGFENVSQAVGVDAR